MFDKASVDAVGPPARQPDPDLGTATLRAVTGQAAAAIIGLAGGRSDAAHEKVMGLGVHRHHEKAPEPASGSSCTAPELRPRRLRSGLTEYATLAVALLVPQGLLLWLDRGPYFFPDTGSYLRSAVNLAPLRNRQVGISFFWRALLEVSRTPLALVVGQTLLMTVAGLLAYASVRRLKASRPLAAGCPVFVVLSPTSLLFQRMLLAEALASLATVATVFFLVKAAQQASGSMCAVAGGFAALAVCAKSDLELIPVAACLAIVLIWPSGGLRARVAAVGLFALVCGSFLAVDVARTQRATGVASLAPWSGMVAIARTRQLVDCRVPLRPPTVRQKVCREGISRRSYVSVLFQAGYVKSLGGLPNTQFRQDNAALLRLAVESIRQNPDRYARSLLASAAVDFGLSDPEMPKYTVHPTAYEMGGLQSDGLRLNNRLTHPLFHTLLGFSRAWYAFRWLILVAAAASLLLRRRSGLDRGLLALTLVWGSTLVPAVLFGDNVPRYVFAGEGVGWILVFASLGGWRRPRSAAGLGAATASATSADPAPMRRRSPFGVKALQAPEVNDGALSYRQQGEDTHLADRGCGSTPIAVTVPQGLLLSLVARVPARGALP